MTERQINRHRQTNTHRKIVSDCRTPDLNDLTRVDRVRYVQDASDRFGMRQTGVGNGRQV